MKGVFARHGAIGFLAIAVWAAGCAPQGSDRPKRYTKDGVITRVDAANGRVTMKIRDEKDQSKFLDKEVVGEINTQTEILINDKQGKIGDLMDGDRIQATGRIEGEGDAQRIVAEEIKVSRVMIEPAVDPRVAGASAPTERPASAAVASGPATQDKNKIEQVKLFIDLLRKNRNEARAQREKLLSEGIAEDAPEILQLDNKLRQIDEFIARTEEQVLEAGYDLSLFEETPASAPAADDASKDGGSGEKDQG
jgi:hypothetical protein